MRLFLTTLMLVVCTAFASGVHAQTADATAPSTPQNLSAQAVSTTRIDLSWASSTDNVGVIGYAVRRNGVHRATTTSKMYSDTGLSAATSYTYSIAAFDAAFNRSPTATTTASTLSLTGAGGTGTGGTGTGSGSGSGSDNGSGIGSGSGSGSGNGATGDRGSPDDPYAFKRQGVFGCSQTGSYSMSVGSLAAVGGVYVPVNDAAVTLNTGYLVYKECVLRGVVNRQREAAIAGTVKQVVSTINTGRDGNPLYVQNLPSEQNDVYARAVVRNLQGSTLRDIPAAFDTPVKRAIAQGYKTALTAPSAQFRCNYAGNLEAVLRGQVKFSFDQLTALMNPVCNPYWSYDKVNRYVHENAQYDVNAMMTQIGWGRGFYPTQQCSDAEGCTTVTPSSIVQENFSSALRSGFEQLERANDIDQMVGALFSGIISQVLGDNRGLLGLTEQTGSQPSYLDQVVRESAQGLRNAAGNAALQILAAAKQIEQAFKSAMDAIAGVLAATAQDLRAKEASCWNIVIQSVCAGSLGSDNTCTEKVSCTTETDEQTGSTSQNCPTGGKLKVATSTAFSQTVINARVATLASSTIGNVEKSDNAIVLIDRLIAGITNTASVDAQRVALQQLDNLVAQRTLHSQYDLQEAQKAREDVTASMETLRSDTLKAWAESTDVTTGWCNVNNPSLINYWKQKWKQ